jgi:hypothetical protein
MIKTDMTPHHLRVTFKDAGIERTKHTDNRRYYERLIAEHGHLSDLVIAPLTLTAEQQARLDEISAAGFSGHDASLYVQYGSTEAEDTGYFYADKLKIYYRDVAAPRITAQRKAAEARGVMVSGVRYSGEASNRQALQEARLAAQDSGQTTFLAWKDSDGQFIANHPVADVEQAFRLIGQLRSELIRLEGEFIDAVASGAMSLDDVDWPYEVAGRDAGARLA